MTQDATKLSCIAMAPVDADGAALLNGERATEVRPGVWMDATAAAALEFLGVRP